MKKILFLLLLTVSSYGQTLQNPTYGNTTTNTLKIKTPATVTSVNFLATVELDGSVNKISPVNLGFALDANVVHKTGNLSESVDGQKTFTSQTNFNAPVFFPANVISASSTKPMIGGLLGDLFLYSARTGADQVGIRFKTNTLTGTRTHTAPNKDGTYALISQTITNGVTENSPSEDAIFDALALKANNSDVIKTTGNQIKTGDFTVNNLFLPLQPLGTTPYKIRGNMATNDYWSIYGEATTTDKGIMVIELGDNGEPFSGIGQKLELRYNGSDGGVSKTAAIFDYNDITFNTNLGVKSSVPTGKLTIGNLSGANPTYKGDITINQESMSSSTNYDAGLEFKIDNTGSGYGKRLIGAFDGIDDYDLHFQSRKNSATWITKFTIKSDGNIKSVGLAGTGTRTVVADASGNLSATSTPPDSRPYKVYSAYFTQSGTSAPTITVLENTLGGTPTGNRSVAGSYTLTLSSAFTANKTFILSNWNVAYNAEVKSSWQDGSNILIGTFNTSGTQADGVAISPQYIEIRVYP